METVTGFTIDSETSQDLDDAVWVEPDGANMRLQVHIADVSKMVPKGAFLDQQAFKRGETLYLPQSIKPMFPQSVEASLSLLPFVERQVVTLGMTLDSAGELLDVQISESTLISQEKFSYEAVEGILRGAPHHLRSQLQQLEQVTKALMQQRQQHGAIYGRSLGSHYVDEDGRVIKKSARPQQMIAELMILSNRVVSEYMHNRQLPWIYRTHDYQDLTALPAQRQQFIQLLEAMEDDEQLRRALAGYYDRAQYSAHPGRHVGLGLEAYTHFTSPIRRYVDLINHRLLKAAIAGNPIPYSQEELETIATSLTERQRWIREQKNAQHREQRQKAVAQQLETDNLEQLPPAEFSRVLKSAVNSQKIQKLEPVILQRLAAETLQPMDFYQILLELPTTAENIPFKLQVWQAIAGKPIILQVINLLRDNWKPGTKVEFREQGAMNEWAALCVVSHDNTEQCPPLWSIARTKAAARTLSAYQWLEAWLWEELTCPEEAQLPAPDEPETATDPANSPTSPALASEQLDSTVDYVSTLNLYAQRERLPLPEYNFEMVKDNSFQCHCEFWDWVGKGEGSSKKKAKSAAAADVWLKIQSNVPFEHS